MCEDKATTSLPCRAQSLTPLPPNHTWIAIAYYTDVEDGEGSERSSVP